MKFAKAEWLLQVLGCALVVACASDDESGGAMAVHSGGTGGSAGTGTGVGGAAGAGGSGEIAGGTGGDGAGGDGAGTSVGGTGQSGAAGTGGSGGTTGGAGGGGAGTGAGGTGGSAGGCGYNNQGRHLEIAPNIEVCLPPVVCAPETCPPQLGTCVDGACVFNAGYEGLRTLPQAWATHYCVLDGGACHGVTQFNFAEQTAALVSAAVGHPTCGSASAMDEVCVGIVASPPMMVGNSQETIDPGTGSTVRDWGLGMTEASGLCYEVTGPGGTALLAVTDRCGGYCTCGGSGVQECGPCVSAADMSPNCACVGPVPGVHAECCGRECNTTAADCDWCASSNHPHFDLDTRAFEWVCGDDYVLGSCELSAARYVPCLDPNPDWPPGGGGNCLTDSFYCEAGPLSHQDLVPGTSCCCNWNLCPQGDGTCAPAQSPCGSGSCACGSGQPDATHPQTSTGCCCLAGLTPQGDGTCN